MMTSPNLYTIQPQSIVMYSTAWCPDCLRARHLLERENIQFLDVDIDQDARAEKFVQHINHGNRSVPTILFPDGTVLVEPSNDQLTQKLRQMQQK